MKVEPKEIMKRTLISNFGGSMKFAFMLLSSLCMVVAAAADNWPAADWYVDDDAAAAGANGSREHPYPTIQQAVQAASANQTIYVAEGVYTNEGTMGSDPVVIPMRVLVELDIINAYERVRAYYINIAETLAGGKR